MSSDQRVQSLYVEPESAPEDTPPALELLDVFKIYRTGASETVALRGLDVRIEDREFVCVLGPSGSGKSTFLAIAAGLEAPSAGDVRVGGESLERLDEAEHARLRARRLAIVFQGGNLWSALSARENVVAALRLADRDEAGAAADEALAAFGLGDRGGQGAATLSGGEQQRVAIAAAAARRAPLVLCDEPTAELDGANESVALEALEELRSRFGSTVVVVSHSERVAAAADRVIEIRDGRAL